MLLADLCTQQGAQGFPTFLVYANGEKQSKFSEARTADNFASVFDRAPPKTEL
jgi:protein-disulfide isomerase-like protein with CxxC motif